MVTINVILLVFLAADDTKNSAQPIAIVHPLRLDHDEPNSYEGNAVPSNSQDQEQNSSDVEVTIISSESPPPVTYIGNPSEELGETSEVSADSSTKVVSLDSKPAGVVESDPGSDHEFVLVPGEVIRRRGSILKNPNAPVSDCSFSSFYGKVLFFNLTLRQLCGSNNFS